ncbi:expressed unknown protein [Seminavis robusta]|uniref:Uncharacterized protein n=1 Tax=Seminavis robusta TaxID=568900 RepID=A0A9N8EYR2_9STRA|nr:expressed unknown protein [Seminavis robusta]|eukprot:Sro1955_g307700.1 n/a (451) ;mRNA; f:9319-10671
MDPAAIQAAVQAAVAAVLQDQAVLDAIRPQQQPAVAVPFAVNPAGTGNNAWDFSSSTGLKMYIASTTPFRHAYDGKESTLRDFLRKIAQRAESFGWTPILMVTDADVTARNITIQHACLTTDLVQAHAITYLRVEGRNHQASACLHKLIMGSITSKLADRLTTRSDKFTVNAAAAVAPGVAPPPPVMKEDGVCMLHELIKLVSVETRASIAIISRKLNNLAQVMEEVESNVEDFNSTVEGLLDQLHSKSVEIPPMLENLFEGYANCTDLTFVKYMGRKQEAYEDGTIEELGYGALMKMAIEKYKILVDKKVWLRKTEEQLEIMTLKAEIGQLKQFPKQQKAKSSTDTEKKSAKQSKDADKYAWKQVAPKTGEPKEKTVGGKEYIFCPHHHTTKWVLKVNDKGIVHRTGCTKMKEARADAAGASDAGSEAAALANAFEQEQDEEAIEDEEV